MTRLESLLLREEGLRLTPYQCPGGRWSVGAGRNYQDRPFGLVECTRLGITAGRSVDATTKALQAQPIRLADALWLLDRDATQVMFSATRVLPWVTRLNDVRQAVLGSMAYQMGQGSRASGKGLLGFKAMLAALRAEAWDVAAMEALDSRRARQTPGRAGREAQLLLTGDWDPEIDRLAHAEIGRHAEAA